VSLGQIPVVGTVPGTVGNMGIRTEKYGALMFSPPTFGPSDNSTRMFSPTEIGSQKRLVHVTFWSL
jgi:hypothetical protein